METPLNKAGEIALYLIRSKSVNDLEKRWTKFGNSNCRITGEQASALYALKISLTKCFDKNSTAEKPTRRSLFNSHLWTQVEKLDSEVYDRT